MPRELEIVLICLEAQVMDVKKFIVAGPTGCKISFSLREKMLLRLVRELRAAGRCDASIADAAAIEHEILIKSGAKVTSVYLSVAADRIKNLANAPSNTSQQEKKEIGIMDLVALTASAKQLNDNGYPLEATPEHPETVLVGDLSSTRNCRRCGKRFIPGEPPTEGELICFYHPERTEVIGGSRVHSCCLGNTNANGCTGAIFHVHEGYQRGQKDLQLRFPRLREYSGNHAALALDAEMIYTQGGYELARLTVVDFFSEAVVMDTFVKPRFPVLDYNTRFSGITADNLGNEAAISFEQLKYQLSTLISPATILIGHSLENDLRVLELFHDRIIDTAILYSNRNGMRSSLKSLALGHLSQFIQNSAEGHDSREDCLTCIHLIKLYLDKQSSRFGDV